jgi:hypothetical protein
MKKMASLILILSFTFIFPIEANENTAKYFQVAKPAKLQIFLQTLIGTATRFRQGNNVNDLEVATLQHLV